MSEDKEGKYGQQCRLCTSKEEGHLKIFDSDGLVKNLSNKIKECLPVIQTVSPLEPETKIQQQTVSPLEPETKIQQQTVFPLEPECCLQEVEPDVLIKTISRSCQMSGGSIISTSSHMPQIKGEVTLECCQYPSSRPSPLTPIHLCLHVQICTPLVKVEPLEQLRALFLLLTTGRKLLLILLSFSYVDFVSRDEDVSAIDNWEEVTPDPAISSYVDFVSRDEDVSAIDNWEEVTPDPAISYVNFVSLAEDVAVCGEVTDADIVAEVLNNNIQTEDAASGDEEDNSSVVQERPIPSAVEAMDHIQELGRFFESRNNVSDSIFKSLNKLELIHSD
uniref:Uncharacterized protein n=1 Tax=Timema bartmani TaxID=61472 RepID=A0A7R9I1G7_9NEOP|nr:unnamed protein product [Timema bartmani]